MVSFGIWNSLKKPCVWYEKIIIKHLLFLTIFKTIIKMKIGIWVSDRKKPQDWIILQNGVREKKTKLSRNQMTKNWPPKGEKRKRNSFQIHFHHIKHN